LAAQKDGKPRDAARDGRPGRSLCWRRGVTEAAVRRLAAGNWKMNGLRADGLALARGLVARAATAAPGCDLLICPPATLIAPLAAVLAGSPIALGAQDCHPAPQGAHTGDISAAMLKDAGCTSVILGHSERRAEHQESDGLVCQKVTAAHAAGLAVILCIGESAEEHAAGGTLAVVARQLAGSLPAGLDAAGLAIAYEPVWAIGSGRTPGVAEVAAVHGHIRRELAGRVADAARVRILYGGSVKPDNAAALMAAADVDGALVGGASLVAADFWAIAQACG
jgi:triosephosphate isomerase (TIM)